MDRHRARRLALQSLCCLDVQGPKVRDLVEDFLTESDETLDTLDVARRVLDGVWAQRMHIDEFLTRHARRWDLARLALVDRNILRLAVHELRLAENPVKVIISEALKLAEEFSSAESPRFITGVLDAVATVIAAGAAGGDEAGGGASLGSDTNKQG